MSYSLWRDWAFWSYVTISALLFGLHLIAVGPQSIWPWLHLTIAVLCVAYLVLVLHVLPRSRRSPARTS